MKNFLNTIKNGAGKKAVTVFIYLLFAAVLVILGQSVIKSGFYYQLDRDEIFHIQAVYLIAHGVLPFTGFFSVYSPLFHYLMLPLSLITGFTFEFFNWARMLMIILFAIRLASLWYIGKRLFGNLAAALAVIFLLLDPFTIFSGMQIRPDNLALTLLAMGIAILAAPAGHHKNRRDLTAGIILGLAVLTNVKIAPSAAILAIGWLIYLIREKQVLRWTLLVGGMIIPGAIFILSATVLGNLPDAIQQLIFDPRLTNEALIISLPFGNFYRPENYFLYGFWGRSVTWGYVWALLIFGFAGAFWDIRGVFARKNSRMAILTVSLVICLAVQFAALFFIKSVFLQYYLPVHLLLALFLGRLVAEIYQDLRSFPPVRFILIMILATSILITARASMTANAARAGERGVAYVEWVKSLWAKVPENEPVFANILFRPLAYPLAADWFYGDIPVSILSRWPTVKDTLIAKKVNYLVLWDYLIKYLDADTNKYISENYVQMDNSEVYRRK